MEDIETLLMQIISYSGDCKSSCIEALDLFKEKQTAPVKIPPAVQDLLAARAAARAAKDYKKSDELRSEIAKLGYQVKDTPQGQKAEKI